MRNAFEARQEVHSLIVKPKQVIRRSQKLKIRDVRQLIVPPRLMNRGIRSGAFVKRIAQVLQGRSDHPQSTSGAGDDLAELSISRSSAMRKFRAVVAFRAGSAKLKEIAIPGTAKTAGVRRVSARRGVVVAQLVKSSISSFKIRGS